MTAKRSQKKRKSKYVQPECTSPAPTPQAAFVLYGKSQRCIEARPWYTFGNRRHRAMLARERGEGDAAAAAAAGTIRSLGPADSLDECAAACASVGLQPRFYFAVAQGECWCCPTW